MIYLTFGTFTPIRRRPSKWETALWCLKSQPSGPVYVWYGAGRIQRPRSTCVQQPLQVKPTTHRTEHDLDHHDLDHLQISHAPLQPDGMCKTQMTPARNEGESRAIQIPPSKYDLNRAHRVNQGSICPKIPIVDHERGTRCSMAEACCCLLYSIPGSNI